MGYADEALQRACPTCGQPPGSRCERKTSRPAWRLAWSSTPARRKGTLMPASIPERTFAQSSTAVAARWKLAAYGIGLLARAAWCGPERAAGITISASAETVTVPVELFAVMTANATAPR